MMPAKMPLVSQVPFMVRPRPMSTTTIIATIAMSRLVKPVGRAVVESTSSGRSSLVIESAVPSRPCGRSTSTSSISPNVIESM